MPYITKDGDNITGIFACQQFDGQEFVESATLYVPPVVPDVTPRQIRMALSRAGLRTSVEAAIAAGSQDLKDWYEFSTTFQRSQPLVVQMGVDLGQSPAQLDALWALAASL
jgi:hypothetical protein